MGANHDVECPCSAPSRSGDHEEPEEGVIPEATAGGEIVLSVLQEAALSFWPTGTVKEVTAGDELERINDNLGKWRGEQSIENFRALYVDVSNVTVYAKRNAPDAAPLVDGIYSVLKVVSEANATELYHRCDGAYEVNQTAQVFSKMVELSRSLESQTIDDVNISRSITTPERFNSTLTEGLLSNGLQIEPYLTKVGAKHLAKLADQFPVNDAGDRTSRLDRASASLFFKSVLAALKAYENVTFPDIDAPAILGRATSGSDVSLNTARDQIQSLINSTVGPVGFEIVPFEKKINPEVATLKLSSDIVAEESANAIRVKDEGNPYDRKFEIVFKGYAANFNTPQVLYNYLSYGGGRRSSDYIVKQFNGEAFEMMKGDQDLQLATEWTRDIVSKMEYIFDSALNRALHNLAEEKYDPKTQKASRVLAGMAIGMRNATRTSTSVDFTDSPTSVKRSVYFMSQYFVFSGSVAGNRALDFVNSDGSEEQKAAYCYALAAGDSSVYDDGLPIGTFGNVNVDRYLSEDYAKGIGYNDPMHTFVEVDYSPQVQLLKMKSEILSCPDLRTAPDVTRAINSAKRYMDTINLNKYAQPILDGRPSVSRDDARRVRELLDDLLKGLDGAAKKSKLKYGYQKAVESFVYQTLSHFMMYGDIRTKTCANSLGVLVGNNFEHYSGRVKTQLDRKAVDLYKDFLRLYETSAGFQSVSGENTRDNSIEKLLDGHNLSRIGADGWKPPPFGAMERARMPTVIRSPSAYHISLWGRSIASLARDVVYRSFDSEGFFGRVVEVYLQKFSGEICTRPTHGLTTLGLPNAGNEELRWNNALNTLARFSHNDRALFRPRPTVDPGPPDCNTVYASSQPWSSTDIINSMTAAGVVLATAAGYRASKRPELPQTTKTNVTAAKTFVRPAKTGVIPDLDVNAFVYDQNGVYLPEFLAGVLVVVSGLANHSGMLASIEGFFLGKNSQVLKPLLLSSAVDCFAISCINGNSVIYRMMDVDPALGFYENIFGPLVSEGAIVGPGGLHAVLLWGCAEALYRVMTFLTPNANHVESCRNFALYWQFSSAAKLITPILWETFWPGQGVLDEGDRTTFLNAWFMWCSVWLSTSIGQSFLLGKTTVTSGNSLSIKTSDDKVVTVEHSICFLDRIRQNSEMIDYGRLIVLLESLPVAIGINAALGTSGFYHAQRALTEENIPGWAVSVFIFWAGCWVSDNTARICRESRALEDTRDAVARSLSLPLTGQASDDRVPRTHSSDYTSAILDPETVLFQFLPTRAGYISDDGMQRIEEVFLSEKVYFYYDNGRDAKVAKKYNLAQMSPKYNNFLHIYYRYDRNEMPTVKSFFDGNATVPPDINPIVLEAIYKITPGLDFATKMAGRSGLFVSDVFRNLGRRLQNTELDIKETQRAVTRRRDDGIFRDSDTVTVRGGQRRNTRRTQIPLSLVESTTVTNPQRNRVTRTEVRDAQSNTTVTEKEVGRKVSPLEFMIGWAGIGSVGAGAGLAASLTGFAFETSAKYWQYAKVQSEFEEIGTAFALNFVVPMAIHQLVVYSVYYTPTMGEKLKIEGRGALVPREPVAQGGPADAQQERRGLLVRISDTDLSKIFDAGNQLNMARVVAFIDSDSVPGVTIVPPGAQLAADGSQFLESDVRVYLDPNVRARGYTTAPGAAANLMIDPPNGDNSNFGTLLPGMLVLSNSSIFSTNQAIGAKIGSLP